MKVLTIFGTRPEAIKMAPILKELSRYNETIVSKVCVTAQHREMLDQALKNFNIIPDYDINIMSHSQDLFDVSINSLAGLKDILKREMPDIILVQGDTTTAFIAALAAYYFKIPVGHVEAGLRTYNKYSPFPEEKNRHLLSVLADYHFAPTEWSKQNLIKENIPEERIFITGNTVIDALQFMLNKIESSGLQLKLERQFKFIDKKKRLVLITGHRRENFGIGFKNICLAIKELALLFPECEFVYPVHLNPNVREPVKELLGNGNLRNIHLIEPLEYMSFVYLMNRSYLILTDSGGIQEESPSLGKPVLVMRNTTERPEGIDGGTVRLVGTDKDKIVNNVFELIDNPTIYKEMSQAVNPYGDGKAAERIVNILLDS